MFNSKKRQTPIYKYEVTMDAYAQEVKKPIFFKNADMFICSNTFNIYNSNSLSLEEIDLIAITRDAELEVGMRVGDDAIIKHINKDARENIIYLKRLK